MALVGIDLGGTQLRVAVADDRGRLRTVVRRPTEAARGRQHVIGRIVAAVADALAEDRTPARRGRALGIGLPGPVDPSAGLVISPANLPGFKNVPLNRILTRATGIPSYLHHDAHLAALGEHRRGAGRGASELIYVTVSTGIGAGLLIRGELYAGAHGSAGEIGHIMVQRDGPLCTCGNRGCVEALASGTGIARAARDLGARTPASALHQLQAPSAEDVVRAARAGDQLAMSILDTAGTYLGIAMGTLINLFNPQLIVLGGSVLKAGAPLLTPMRRSMLASSWKAARRGLRIDRPALGDDAGPVGGGVFARLAAGQVGPAWSAGLSRRGAGVRGRARAGGEARIAGTGGRRLRARPPARRRPRTSDSRSRHPGGREGCDPAGHRRRHCDEASPARGLRTIRDRASRLRSPGPGIRLQPRRNLQSIEP